MKTIARLAGKALDAILLTPGAMRDVDKAAGLYVHRVVLNAKQWHDWAVAAGVPNVLPLTEMHVTIMNSPVGVTCKPDTRALACSTMRSQVCLFGPNEDALVVVVDAWSLWDRHWELHGMGALDAWESYRPHVTLSYGAAGFDMPLEAMAKMPDFVILGPEIHSGSRMAEALLAPPEMVTYEMAASVAEAAMAKGLVSGELDLLDEYALRDAVRMGKAVTFKGAEAEIMKILKPDSAAEGRTVVEIDGKKFIERDLTMTMRPLTEEVRAKIGRTVDAFKNNDEERLAWGWASVSTIKGEFLKDLQDDTITTKAQRQWLHSLMKGQRIGKMDHAGDAIAEVVEGLVFDAELQAALGIDLGMEGVLTCTHYICEKTWSMVKTGEWMHSIAGRVLIEVEE